MAQDKDKLFEKIYFMWKGEGEKRNLSIDFYCEHSMAGKQQFAYHNDGEYTIDNLVATERTVRNMTIQRKNSLFFCSDKDARNSAIYNTFISTCPKSASDDNRGMKISDKSLKLTIQKFNDPTLRAVKRVYTQFWTDTSINQIYEK